MSDNKFTCLNSTSINLALRSGLACFTMQVFWLGSTACFYTSHEEELGNIEITKKSLAGDHERKVWGGWLATPWANYWKLTAIGCYYYCIISCTYLSLQLGAIHNWQIAAHKIWLLHHKRKILYTADTLSRAPSPARNLKIALPSRKKQNVSWKQCHWDYQNDLAPTVRPKPIIWSVPLSWDTCASVKGDSRNTRWKKSSSHTAWAVRATLTVHENLLLYGSRIVAPVSFQQETLSKILTKD